MTVGSPDGPRRVLVVDDEEGVRISVAANLELEGHEVLEADCAEAALQMMARENGAIDGVLSDIRMPGMDGVQMLASIRARWPRTPVILMTAFTSEQLVNQAILAGAFTVLGKPFDMETGARALARAMRRSRVLVVDDVASEAEAQAAALSAAGLDVCTATSGEAALQMVRDGNIDVCITDLSMPGMDGPVLIERLRALDRELTVIACSGYQISGLFQRAAGAGARACLRKPIWPRALVELIARVRAQPDGNPP
jgi:CheY-like chemotaxis protein